MISEAVVAKMRENSWEGSPLLRDNDPLLAAQQP